MKNKKVILSSILSLVCCLCLIVGGTFAFFTAEYKTNIAVNAGTVEVKAWIDDMVTYTLGEKQADNTFALGGTASYDSTNNELTLTDIAPGDRVDLNVYVENLGTLATAYRVKVDFGGGLKDVLVAELTVGKDDTAEKLTATATASKWLNFNGNETVVLPMSIELPFTAGNEYQGEGATIVITVEAIQANAVDQVVIGDTQYETLTEAMGAANVGDAIVLGSGTYELDSVKTNGSLEIAEGADVTLVLSENATIATNKSEEVNTPTVVNKGNLTIEGGTIKNDNTTNVDNKNVPAIQNVEGVLTLKNCTIENNAPTSGGAYCVDVKGGKVILENCTVKGNRGGISVFGNGSIEMIGGSVEATVYYPVYLVDDATAEFENVTFTKNNSTKGKALIYNAMTNGSATFTNCTFVSNISSETKLEINNNFEGLTFTDCTFTNVTNPNE